MGTPYMVSDVGGMSELVDLDRYSEAVVPGGNYAELAVALQTVLERGTLPALPLRQEVGLVCRHYHFTHWLTGYQHQQKHEYCVLCACIAFASNHKDAA